MVSTRLTTFIPQKVFTPSALNETKKGHIAFGFKDNEGNSTNEVVKAFEEAASRDLQKVEDKKSILATKRKQLTEGITDPDNPSSFINSAKAFIANIHDLAKELGAFHEAGDTPAAFLKRTTTLVHSNPQSKSEDYVSVTVASGTAPRNLSLFIDRLATTDRLAGTKTFNSRDQQNNSVNASSFTLSTPSGTADITIPEKASLDQIVASINAVSHKVPVTAHLEQSNGTFYIVMDGQKEGEKVTISNSQGNLLNQLGLDESDLTTQALSAKVLVGDGAGRNAREILSTSNTLTNIDGLTLELKSPTKTSLEKTSSGFITIAVKKDVQTPLTKMKDLITAVQSWENFANFHFAKDPEGKYYDDSLANGKLLREVNRLIIDIFSQGVAGLTKPNSTTPYGVGDHGISILYNAETNTNSLKVDYTKLENFFSRNPEVAQKFFSFTYSSSSDGVVMNRSPKLLSPKLSGKDITLTVSKDMNGTLSVSYNSATEGLKTGEISSLGRITAPKGTSYENIDLYVTQSFLTSLSNGGSTAITLNCTSGLCDKLFQRLGNDILLEPISATDSQKGLLYKELDEIDTAEKSQTRRQETIQKKAEARIERYVKSYARANAAIEKGRQTLQMLEIMDKETL